MQTEIKDTFGMIAFNDPDRFKAILTDMLPGDENNKTKRRMYKAVSTGAVQNMVALIKAGHNPHRTLSMPAPGYCRIRPI